MLLNQLKDQVNHLTAREQRELIAYLIALQTKHDEAFQHQLATKIDDTDPSHWIELNDLRNKFSLIDIAKSWR